MGSRDNWQRIAALLLTSTTPKLSGLAIVFGVASALVAFAAQAERINHEGRILGPAPVVTTPTLFNTPQADAINFGRADHAARQRLERRHFAFAVVVQLCRDDRADQKRSLRESPEPACV